MMKALIFFIALCSSIGLYWLSNANGSSSKVVISDKSSIDDTGKHHEHTWKIFDEQTVSYEAERLHQMGRLYGQQGQHELAIKTFDQASQIEPNWSYPHYDKAFSFLLMGDIEKAYQNYKIVDKLSPQGFFTTKTSVFYLDKELKGVFPKGLYLQYLKHEWLETNQEKEQLLQGIVTEYPSYSPAWFKLSSFQDDPEKKIALMEKGLSFQTDPETRGYLLINKSITRHHMGYKAEAIQTLEGLLTDQSAPLDIIELTKETLNRLEKN